MKYMSMVKGETQVEEITEERARFLIENCYIKEFVDDLFDNHRCFRLQTMTRTIWTKTDDGLVPMPGFLGVID